MRVATVSELKGRSGGRNDYPALGTAYRAILDCLTEKPGCVVDMADLARKYPDGRFGHALERLRNDYGMDIRKVHPRKHDGLYVLAGEWFGANYSDYVAAAYAAPIPQHSEMEG
jgi:hypothetical protein